MDPLTSARSRSVTALASQLPFRGMAALRGAAAWPKRPSLGRKMRQATPDSWSCSSLGANMALLAAAGSFSQQRRAQFQGGWQPALSSQSTRRWRSSMSINSRAAMQSREAADTAATASQARKVLLAEATAMKKAQEELAAKLAEARRRAGSRLHRGKPPAPPPPDIGLEDAPEEVRKRIEAMTCGSNPYPADLEVEEMWRQLSTAPGGSAASDFAPAWSPWRLRAIGPTLAQCLLSSATTPASSADDEVVLQHAAEALERWFGLATCLAGGVLGGGAPAAAEALEECSGKRVEAYVTHLTDDDYVVGAVALAASLVCSGTTRPMLALVTDGVSPEGRRVLHNAGWALLDVSLAGLHGVDSQHIRGYFSKIWLWGLPCHSVIYLDTDVIVLDNLDHLFGAADGVELAAVPDSQPYEDHELVVQAGLIVATPSSHRFADLWEVCCGERRPESLDSWKMHEQGFLAKYFDGENGVDARGPGEPRPHWRSLPARYNFNVRYHLRTLYDGVTIDNVSVVHYACCKPWDPKQRHFAPPAYAALFLEFVSAAGLPWTPRRCHMDELREQEQQAKLQKLMSQQQRQAN